MGTNQSKQAFDTSSAVDSRQPDAKLGIGARILGTVSNFLAGMNGRESC